MRMRKGKEGQEERETEEKKEQDHEGECPSSCWNLLVVSRDEGIYSVHNNPYIRMCIYIYVFLCFLLTPGKRKPSPASFGSSTASRRLLWAQALGFYTCRDGGVSVILQWSSK